MRVPTVLNSVIKDLQTINLMSCKWLKKSMIIILHRCISFGAHRACPLYDISLSIYYYGIKLSSYHVFLCQLVSVLYNKTGHKAAVMCK